MGAIFPCSAGFCVSITEVPVARALLGVGERLRERLLGGLQLAWEAGHCHLPGWCSDRWCCLPLLPLPAGHPPRRCSPRAEVPVAASRRGRRQGQLSIWLAPRLTCSKSRPSAELKPTVVSRFSKALSSPVLGVSAFAAAGTSEEFVHPLLQLLPRHVGGLRNLRRRMPPSGVKGAWGCPRG